MMVSVNCQLDKSLELPGRWTCGHVYIDYIKDMVRFTQTCVLYLTTFLAKIQEKGSLLPDVDEMGPVASSSCCLYFPWQLHP